MVELIKSLFKKEKIYFYCPIRDRAFLAIKWLNGKYVFNSLVKLKELESGATLEFHIDNVKYFKQGTSPYTLRILYGRNK